MLKLLFKNIKFLMMKMLNVIFTFLNLRTRKTPSPSLVGSFYLRISLIPKQ